MVKGVLKHVKSGDETFPRHHHHQAQMKTSVGVSGVLTSQISMTFQIPSVCGFRGGTRVDFEKNKLVSPQQSVRLKEFLVVLPFKTLLDSFISLTVSSFVLKTFSLHVYLTSQSPYSSTRVQRLKHDGLVLRSDKIKKLRYSRTTGILFEREIRVGKTSK